MPQITTKHLHEEGKKARERASERAHGQRISARDWYPEVIDFQSRGWTTAQIAEALRYTPQRINQILAGGAPDERDADRRIALPEAVKLSQKCQAMVEWTVEAFEAFFNEYSGEVLQDFQRPWIAAFLGHKRLLLNVPMRHAKSTTMGVWLSIWLLARNRDEQILFVSAGKDVAMRHAGSIAWHLAFNIPLNADFGRFAPVTDETIWRPSAGELQVLGRTPSPGGGQLSVQVRGSGQHILGMEATVVIADDVTDFAVSESPTERAKRSRWLREEVLSRLDRKGTVASGRAVVLGQRVHINDIYAELAALTFPMGPRKGQQVWHHIVSPAIIKWPEREDFSDAQVLWPDKWGYEELMDMLGDLGTHQFMCMMQQTPAPEEGELVDPAWWERVRDYERPAGEGYRDPEGEEETFLPIVRVLSIDPSPTRWNAYVVADVVCSRDTFFCTIVELGTWKGGTSEMQRLIDQKVGWYKPDYFILESSTGTKWFEGDPYFTDLGQRVSILRQVTGKNKHDVEWGVRSLAADIEAARIRTPYGDASGREQCKLLEEQMNLYGYMDEDDILMALWFIKANYRKLRPRVLHGGGFTHRMKGGWSYLARERGKNALRDDPKAKQAREWEKRHGIRR